MFKQIDQYVGLLCFVVAKLKMFHNPKINTERKSIRNRVERLKFSMKILKS